MNGEELVQISREQAKELRSLLDEMRKRVPMSKKRRGELDTAIRQLDEAWAESIVSEVEKA